MLFAKYALYLTIALGAVASPALANQSGQYIARTNERFPGVQTYLSPIDQTIYYVETSGKFISAISKSGVILWTREPHLDANLPKYRTENPKIVWIGAPLESQLQGRSPKDYVAITFNNSQFGLLSVKTGDFEFRGND